MEKPAAEGTMAEAVPEIDVWAWSRKDKPALDELLEVKQAVLAHTRLRRELESHLEQVDPEKDPRVAGLAWWLLARYERAWPVLSQVRRPSPAERYALAECALKGQVFVEEAARTMPRPDLAVELLGKDELTADLRGYVLALEAMVAGDDMEGLAKALKKPPKGFSGSADEHYFRGRLAEAEGDYTEAEKAYLAALGEDAGHRGALVRLAYQYDLGGQEDEAIRLYERLADLRPTDANAMLNYGLLMEDRELYQRAIECYRTVLEYFPGHQRARAYLRDATGSLNMVFDEDVERRHDKRNRLLRIPINDFELSVRARNCLAKMRIETLGDLVQKTEAELLAYKNFGETSLTEIKALLDAKGLRLGMNLDEDPVPLHPLEEKEEAPEHPQVELPPGVDPKILNIVLADMDLSVRVRKALSQLRVVTLGDLLTHSEQELLSLKNFGQTSLNELKACLAEYGVSLPGD